MTNPTSNFGWQMPTSSDLVTDLPADFEVFGQAVDTSLADLKGGTTGQVLKKNSNTDMDFVWSADAAGMTNPMTTTADMIYSSSGSTPARLGIGTNGQILTVAGGVPTWATPAGGGKILQVLNATYGTQTLVSQNSSWVDTGLTVSITPSNSSNKVLIFANLNGLRKSSGHAENTIGFRLLRNSTNILDFEGKALFTDNAESNAVGSSSTTYLDSPATTSATTYKVQMINYKYSSYVGINDYWAGPPAMYSASTITVMEVGA